MNGDSGRLLAADIRFSSFFKTQWRKSGPALYCALQNHGLQKNSRNEKPES